MRGYEAKKKRKEKKRKWRNIELIKKLLKFANSVFYNHFSIVLKDNLPNIESKSLGWLIEIGNTEIRPIRSISSTIVVSQIFESVADDALRSDFVSITGKMIGMDRMYRILI